MSKKMYHSHNMKKYTMPIAVTILFFSLVISAFILYGLQQVQAVFQKGVAQGKDVRLAELNACPIPSEDQPNFNGCNSVL